MIAVMEKTNITYWGMVWRQLKQNRLAMVGLFITVLLLLVAICAPLLANNRPLVLYYQNHIYFPAILDYSRFHNVDFKELKEELKPGEFAIFPPVPYSATEYDLTVTLEAPSKKHWLGTDDRGRDVLARMIYGARISLSVGFVAVSIAAVIGVLLGSIAGYFGGIVDHIINRLIEIILTIPTFFLIIAIIAFLPPSIYNIMAVIGLTGWTGIARLVRAEILKLKKMEFVLAAKALGASHARIITRHLLPNAMAPVLVSVVFGIAGAILTESSLSFLGFGVPPPTPSWGDILSQSRDYIEFAWWLTTFPGLAIFISITAYNLVGEGLRDAMDPKLFR